MTTEMASRAGGNFCVVVRVDGSIEVKRFSEDDNKAVFAKAREYIGCKWLDHVIVQAFTPEWKLEYLVNDNGYAEWGNDPKKVNQIATYIYNGGNAPDHYILGDVVFCFMVETDEGGEFIGMSEEAANRIASETKERILPKAREIVPIPWTVPDPLVKISSFATIEDMVKAMQGDESVKPIDETVVSGGNAKEEA